MMLGKTIKKALERADVITYKDFKTNEVVFVSRNEDAPLTDNEKKEIAYTYAVCLLQPVRFANKFNKDKGDK